MGEGLEVWPLQIRAEDLPDALGARKLLEADEARAVAKQSTARPPMRGFSGQRRLAHAAHRVQHDGAVRVVLLVGVFASTLCARTTEPPYGKSRKSSRYVPAKVFGITSSERESKPGSAPC